MSDDLRARRVGRWRAIAAVAITVALSGGGLASASTAKTNAQKPGAAHLLATGSKALSCYAPAGNPNPKTDPSAWSARDRANELCSTQRLTDELSSPTYAALSAMEVAGSNPDQVFGDVTDARLRSWGSVLVAGGDPFRVPTRWAAMGRGQFEEFNFISITGAELQAELFSPNPQPGTRYPIVTFSPGLQEAKEQAWWYGEGLAEAGYVVLIIDPQGQGDSEITSHDGSQKCNPLCDFPTEDKDETQAAIDFAVSTPAHPYRYDNGRNGEHTPRFNPLWREVERHELGIAGHSLGATAVNPVGQADPRVKAVISYDDLDAAIPANLVKKIHAPALYFGTDYGFPTFATPRSPSDPPNPDQHWPSFRQLRSAGVDSMVIVPRASTHYEWDQQSAVGSLPASRLGQVTSLYYTLGWYDRYLKDRPSALRRLTAQRYDGSADRHSIGAGTYDAAAALADPGNPFAGNVAYTIRGMCIANTLSFYFASAYSLDGGRIHSWNMRNRGCR